MIVLNILHFLNQWNIFCTRNYFHVKKVEIVIFFITLCFWKRITNLRSYNSYLRSKNNHYTYNLIMFLLNYTFKVESDIFCLQNYVHNSYSRSKNIHKTYNFIIFILNILHLLHFLNRIKHVRNYVNSYLKSKKYPLNFQPGNVCPEYITPFK